MKRVALTLAAVAVALSLAGCGSGSTPPPATVTVTAPPSTTVESGSASDAADHPPEQVTIPDVVGQNGAIVYDQLQQLGLTKVQYASRDKDDKVVLNPANWSATKIEPKAGSTVMSNQTVVVTMTKDQ